MAVIVLYMVILNFSQTHKQTHSCIHNDTCTHRYSTVCKVSWVGLRRCNSTPNYETVAQNQTLYLEGYQATPLQALIFNRL